MCRSVAQLCPAFCDPMDCSPPILCPWDFTGKNTGVGCHTLLQGISLTQGSNQCLLRLVHWQMDSLSLSHLGSPPLAYWHTFKTGVNKKTVKTCILPFRNLESSVKEKSCALLSIVVEVCRFTLGMQRRVQLIASSVLSGARSGFPEGLTCVLNLVRWGTIYRLMVNKQLGLREIFWAGNLVLEKG